MVGKNGLVAVKLMGKPRSAQQAGSCGLAVVLSGERTITVSAGFDAATLQRLREVIHLQVALFTPFRAGHVPQTSSDQHERRLAIRERSHHSRSSPDFLHQPFHRVIGPETAPVFRREA